VSRLLGGVYEDQNNPNCLLAGIGGGVHFGHLAGLVFGGGVMKAIINWLKRWLGPVPPAVTDEHCPYCHGIGYDSSGYWCSCLREKK
jgi:hypothetical protein